MSLVIIPEYVAADENTPLVEWTIKMLMLIPDILKSLSTYKQWYKVLLGCEVWLLQEKVKGWLP